MGTMPKRPTKSAEQIYNENPDLKRDFDSRKAAERRADVKILELQRLADNSYGDKRLELQKLISQLREHRAAGDATEIDDAISWVDNKLSEDEAEKRRNLPMSEAERRKALTDARRKK